MRRSLGTLLAIVGCAVLLAWVTKPAAAGTITYDVTFGATNFTPNGPVDFPPVTFVLGHFGVTLEPGQSSSGNATLFGILLNVTSPVVFNYLGGIDQLQIEANEFLLTINTFTASPNYAGFVYTQALSGGGSTPLFTAGSGNVLVTQVAATPIPAALPLFAAALGGLGFVGWRRRKTAAA
jgi:hypothetical protein